MKDLVTTDNQGHFETNTRIIANMLKDGVNKKRDDAIHKRLLVIVESKILHDYQSINLFATNESNVTSSNNYYECDITGATFTESIYTYGTKNNKAKMYVLNEEAFHLLITHITGYKKARDINLQFILAFKQLKQHFQRTKDLSRMSEKDLIEAILPIDKHGTASVVNGEPRVELVHGYYRSKNAKVISENLVKRIEVTQLNIFGEFEVYTQKLNGRI